MKVGKLLLSGRWSQVIKVFARWRESTWRRKRSRRTRTRTRNGRGRGGRRGGDVWRGKWKGELKTDAGDDESQLRSVRERERGQEGELEDLRERGGVNKREDRKGEQGAGDRGGRGGESVLHCGRLSCNLVEMTR